MTYRIRMRTTIDLPDELFHRAKIVAAQRRTTLKELVLQGLEYATRTPALDSDAERRRRAQKLIAALQASNHEPFQPLSREEIYTRGDGHPEA